MTGLNGGLDYKYDGDGKRVYKVAGGDILYWYGAGSEALGEFEACLGQSSNVEYLFFGGKRIVRLGSSITTDYYFADHLGSSRVVTNSSGSILDDSDFYPFGGERANSSSSGNTYKFTGKERDIESGLDNFGARYNSSSLGRFISPDETLVDQQPEDPQSWNLYSYVRNNPLNHTDPTGNACVPNGNGGWKNDDNGGQSCAEANDPRSNNSPSAIVSAGPLPLTWRQWVGLDAEYNKVLRDEEQRWRESIERQGYTVVRAELPIGPGDLEALGELLRPAGAKMAQIIARLGKGFGNPEIAMKELTALRDGAAAAGQSATGFYIQADATIYRAGTDYLTVAKDGKVLSYVKNATPGEGVALKYSQLGGK